jgi:osmotically-inducible protein OsmY
MKKSCLRIAVVLTLMLSLLQAAQAADTGMGQTIDDSAITAKVKGKIMADKNLDASEIRVDTEDGRVMLSGRVETGAEKARAAEIARSVEGVTQVENDLTSPACPIGANWRC